MKMSEIFYLRIFFAFAITLTIISTKTKVSAAQIFLRKACTVTPNVEESDGKNCTCRGDRKRKGNGDCPPFLFPESGEGPFFLPNQSVRSDVTEHSPGIPLLLKINVTQDDESGCKLLKSASVHIWHANASGIYSAYLGYYPIGEPGSKPFIGTHVKPTDATTFLRGIQYTNEKGEVAFETIYPGWYLARSPHINFKIITQDGIEKLAGAFYFPDDINDKVATVEPYAQNKQERKTNGEDRKFINYSGGDSLVEPEGNAETGFKCEIYIRVKS